MFARRPDASDQIVLGYGDDIFMVGRFITFDGKQRNTPVVRFGQISMLPAEPVEVDGGRAQEEVFLVECRSIGGLSGSPVFVDLQTRELTYPRAQPVFSIPRCRYRPSSALWHPGSRANQRGRGYGCAGVAFARAAVQFSSRDATASTRC